MTLYSASFKHGDKTVMVSGPTLHGVRMKAKEVAHKLGVSSPTLRWYGNTTARLRGAACNVLYIDEKVRLQEAAKFAALFEQQPPQVFEFQREAV